jgi:hypothetical protein
MVNISETTRARIRQDVALGIDHAAVVRTALRQGQDIATALAEARRQHSEQPRAPLSEDELNTRAAAAEAMYMAFCHGKH